MRKEIQECFELHSIAYVIEVKFGTSHATDRFYDDVTFALECAQ